MALKQNTVLYTWRHGPSQTGSWVNERSAIWTRNSGLLSGSLSFVREPPPEIIAQADGSSRSAPVLVQAGQSTQFYNAELHLWYTNTVY